MTMGASFGEQRGELRRGGRVIEMTALEFNDYVTKPRGTRELRALTRQSPLKAYKPLTTSVVATPKKAERPTPLFEA
jgi:hypothetical protein